MTGEAARSPPHEGEGSPEPDYPPQKLYASLVSRLSGPYRLPSIDKVTFVIIVHGLFFGKNITFTCISS